MGRTKYANAVVVASLLILVGAWAVVQLSRSHRAGAVVAPPTRPAVRVPLYKVAMQASTPTDTPTPGPTAGVWPIPTYGIAANPTEYVSHASLQAIATMAAAPNPTTFLTYTHLAQVPINISAVQCCGVLDSRLQFITSTDVTDFIGEYTGTFKVQGWLYSSDRSRSLASYWLILTGSDAEVTIPTPIGTSTLVPTPTGTVMVEDRIAKIPRLPQASGQPTKMPMNVAAWHVVPLSSTAGTAFIESWHYGWSYYEMVDWLRKNTTSPYYAWRP